MDTAIALPDIFKKILLENEALEQHFHGLSIAEDSESQAYIFQLIEQSFTKRTLCFEILKTIFAQPAPELINQHHQTLVMIEKQNRELIDKASALQNRWIQAHRNAENIKQYG